MIRVFKTKSFKRWSKKENISDTVWIDVVKKVECGNLGVNLGGGCFKKRVAKGCKGKRGGYRIILVFKQENRAVFIFGYSKKDRQNIDEEEREAFKRLAKIYLSISTVDIEKMCASRKLWEISYEEER